MKKLFLRTLFACAVAVASFASSHRAFSQSSSAPVFAIPLTNNAVFPFTNLLGFTNTLVGGFTNTLVQPTNLSHLRLTNVVTLLLNLQTNVEETLPVLGVLTSNATVAIPSGTTQAAPTIVPITQAPAGMFLSPTGQSTNQQTPLISMTLGTNVIEIDPATFQGLVQLRDVLEQALPVLQMLNGTAPTETNTFITSPITTPLTNAFVPARNFGFRPLTRGFPPPLTQAFPPPLTNGRPRLTNPSPF
jgi:hypothetical protein